jgi:hypothetical protein
MAGKVTVKRASFASSFPKTMAVPELLLEFADWLDLVPHGGVGTFDVLGGEKLEEAFPDPRLVPALCEHLALFLRLPDASWLALWDHGGAEPAVVLLGSEGELGNVAPGLRDFLVALGQGKTGVADLDDEDAGSHRAALATWLGAGKKRGRREKQGEVPDFAGWYQALLEGRAPPVEQPAPAGPGSFAMADFTRTATGFLGAAADDPGLRALLESLGHWPVPKFKSDERYVYLEDKPRGFCLYFKEGERAPGAKSGPAVLDGIFWYSEGKDGYRGYTHPMPMGITWADSAATLPPRLGAPDREMKNKATGLLSSHRWLAPDDARRYVTVSYKNDGAVITLVFAGLLSKAP